MDKNLHIEVSPAALPRFFGFFSKGVGIDAEVGRSIREVLCGQIGLAPHYLDHRIQTVFLDGKAVDSVDESIIGHGSVLALSAAMPGLAGATLRKGGHYAGMRKEISHGGAGSADSRQAGRFTIKLFNVLQKETGPMFLSRGIWVPEEDFQRFLHDASAEIGEGCRSVQMDGEPTTWNALKNYDWTRSMLHLFVIST